MRFNHHFTSRYIQEAPLALALERAYECHILSQQDFKAPILDLGCGDGIFAGILCAEPIDTGLDPDQRQLDKARATAKYKELICSSGAHIPKPDNSYRTIFSNSVLEHIQDLPDVLREARRVLAQDGRLFVTIPTDCYDHFTVGNQVLSGLGLNSAAARFRRFFNRLWKHYHYYDINGWGRYFDQCGFSVVQSRPYNPKPSCILLDALVPLSIISFMAHRGVNRWFFIPGLRRLYAPVLSLLLTPLMARFLPLQKQAGLIFFELRKKAV